MVNPYVDMLPGPASVRLARARLAWLSELQLWQLAAWHHVAVVSIGLMSLSWMVPPPEQPPTVAERMAARSMTVVVGGRD